MERNSIRLRNFDYTSGGAYFITICSHQRKHLFGTIKQRKMQLNELGTIILEQWQHMGELRKSVFLDEFVIMPNHIHSIICIQPAVGAGRPSPSGAFLGSRQLASPNPPMPNPPMPNTSILSIARKELFLSQTEISNIPNNAPVNSLGAIIGGFKAAVSRVTRVHLENPFLQVWQRNYFERIVRNEPELNAVREYIAHNPLNWLFDLEAKSDANLHDFANLEVAA